MFSVSVRVRVRVILKVPLARLSLGVLHTFVGETRVKRDTRVIWEIAICKE